MDCIIGIDIGTTSTIGIVIALPDQVLATASRPVSLSSPRQSWAEEDPNQWWANVCEIVPELLSNAAISKADVKGIGVTGMLPAVVLLDREGQLIRPSIQQSDGRCGEQARAIAAEFDEKQFVKRTGNGINQQLVAAKLRWLKTHEPESFARISTVFGSYDYINWRLTEQRRVEQNWALEAGFVDLHSGLLAEDLIRIGQIDPEVIPPKIASHEKLGVVSEAAAVQTGLAAGTPVVGGAADHIASAYVAGIVEPGDVLLKFGGAADILLATDQLRPDPRMFSDLHLVPELYMPNGCMATGGSALNWFVAQFAQGQKAQAENAGMTLHQFLDQCAEPTPPGADGVLIVPYFLGEKTPIHDPDARGIISGLSLNHEIGHLWRALLEAYGYAFRHHIEVFNHIGYPTQRFLASDGGSNSAIWMQICADILQSPIQLLSGHPGSCLGAAWMAVIGCGLSGDWNGVTNFVTYGEKINPRSEYAALYDAGYQRFHSIYQTHAAL